MDAIVKNLSPLGRPRPAVRPFYTRSELRLWGSVLACLGILLGAAVLFGLMVFFEGRAEASVIQVEISASNPVQIFPLDELGCTVGWPCSISGRLTLPALWQADLEKPSRMPLFYFTSQLPQGAKDWPNEWKRICGPETVFARESQAPKQRAREAVVLASGTNAEGKRSANSASFPDRQPKRGDTVSFLLDWEVGICSLSLDGELRQIEPIRTDAPTLLVIGAPRDHGIDWIFPRGLSLEIDVADGGVPPGPPQPPPLPEPSSRLEEFIDTLEAILELAKGALSSPKRPAVGEAARLAGASPFEPAAGIFDGDDFFGSAAPPELNSLLIRAGCGWEPKNGTTVVGATITGRRVFQRIDTAQNPWKLAAATGDTSCSDAPCKAAARGRYGLDKWTSEFHLLDPPGGWCDQQGCGRGVHGYQLYAEALQWQVSQPSRPGWLAGLGALCNVSQQELYDAVATGHGTELRTLFCAQSGLCPSPPPPPPPEPPPGPPEVLQSIAVPAQAVAGRPTFVSSTGPAKRQCRFSGIGVELNACSGSITFPGPGLVRLFYHSLAFDGSTFDTHVDVRVLPEDLGIIPMLIELVFPGGRRVSYVPGTRSTGELGTELRRP